MKVGDASGPAPTLWRGVALPVGRPPRANAIPSRRGPDGAQVDDAAAFCEVGWGRACSRSFLRLRCQIRASDENLLADAPGHPSAAASQRQV